MNVIKEVKQDRSAPVDMEELAAVNALARRELGEEEVYLFSVRLCDNEVDRDGERFSVRTLEELAPMFVGKSGIFDHQWTAKGQTARIYQCEVVHEPGQVTRAGEGYCWLKGHVYMLRTRDNQTLIDEIEAGIKKEVSVGCAVGRKVCSICGADVMHERCEHRKGEHYDGKLCYYSLEQARDAYEFSFVAVPAQPAAGVVKGWQPDDPRWEQLEEEAALGRAYQRQLREEVVRLGLLAGLGLEAKTLREMVGVLSHAQLEELKKAYGRKAGQNYPLRTQLSYGERQEQDGQRDAAFLV